MAIPANTSVILPLIRQLIPNLIASQLVGVQPIIGPSGSIFELRTRYGRTFGDGSGPYYGDYGVTFSPDGLTEYWYFNALLSDVVQMSDWCTGTFGPLRTKWHYGEEYGTHMFIFESEQDLSVFLLRWQ